MSQPFSTQKFSSDQAQKSVFASSKNERKVNCSLINVFQHKQILVCTEGQKQQQISSRETRKEQDMTATKLSKKSLKSYNKINEFFKSTVRKQKQKDYIKKSESKTQKKTSSSRYQLSRQESKVFSKTTLSEIRVNFIEKSPVTYSKQSNIGQQLYKCSSQNQINWSFQKGPLSQLRKVDNQKLIHAPIAQFFSKNSSQRLTGTKLSKQVRPSKKPSTFNFQKVNFIKNVSQSLRNSGIPLVKQVVIPQVSQRSVLNSRNPTQIQDQTKNLWRGEKNQIKDPLSVYTMTLDEYPQSSRSTSNKKIKDLVNQSISLEAIREKRTQKVMGYEKKKVRFQSEKKDYLQILSEKKEQQMNENDREIFKVDSKKRHDELYQAEKDKYNHPHQASQLYNYQMRHSQVNNTNINSTPRNVFSTSINQKSQIRTQQLKFTESQLGFYSSIQVLNQVLDNQIQTQQQKSKQYQQYLDDQRQIAKNSAPKIQHIPFGNHSAQIPRSNKLSGMKVRRTISMKDHDQSQEQKTSEVIYGFRKSHKEDIMEDINEDIQESRVTPSQQNWNNNINLGDFRQLLM